MSNLPLKFKILSRFHTQADFAMEVGEHETKISQIVRGRRELSPVEQEKWADVLRCKPEEIFGTIQSGSDYA